MGRSLIEFFIRERLLVFLGIIAALGFGWYAANQVPIDAIPNVG